MFLCYLGGENKNQNYVSGKNVSDDVWKTSTISAATLDETIVVLPKNKNVDLQWQAFYLLDL